MSQQNKGKVKITNFWLELLRTANYVIKLAVMLKNILLSILKNVSSSLTTNSFLLFLNIKAPSQPETTVSHLTLLSHLTLQRRNHEGGGSEPSTPTKSRAHGMSNGNDKTFLIAN